MTQKKTPRGFTIFFAVLVGTLALAIGLAIFDITVRQLELSATSAQSQYAIYAADAGIECGLYWDRKYGGNGTAFATSSASATPPANTVLCNSQDVYWHGNAPSPIQAYPTNWISVIPILSGSAATTTFTLLFPPTVGTLPASYGRCAVVQVANYNVSGSASSHQIFLSGSGTWVVPSDWNSSNNTIEVIGGGGGGSGGSATEQPSGGGGGGGYSEITNLTLTPGVHITYNAGTAGAGGGANGSGGAGGDAYFDGPNCAGALVCAKGGSGGITSGGGGLGGQVASGTGSIKYSGGTGGTSGLTRGSGSGGGGAAGPGGPGGAGGPTPQGGSGGGSGGGGNGGGSNGNQALGASAGAAGGNNAGGTGGGAGGASNAGNPGTNGGGGGGGFSGAAGATGGLGGAGIEWSSRGSGGGGGGAGAGGNRGGNGGAYGGGGGSGGSGGAPGPGGSGSVGTIVITYLGITTGGVERTTITSQGYNICLVGAPGRVQRTLQARS